MLRLEAGQGLPGDVDKLEDIASNIAGRSFCALGDAASWPVQALIRNFRPVIEARIDDYAAAHRVAAE